MPPSDSILLVDDDRCLADSTARWLGERGYSVDVAHSFAEAEAKLARSPFDVVLTDQRLGDGDGLELIRQTRRFQPGAGTLLVTGYPTPATAIEAARAGAVEVLTKPWLDEQLLAALDRARQGRGIAEQNERLRRELDSRLACEPIVSQDPRMLKVFRMIDSVADARASVLITGENGTGKSLVARAIHQRSRRRHGPFIEVACGALPDTLLESELFGHVAGAFTGAVSNRMGKFELAQGGTLFLDEIGTASPALQVKLLRVLQEFRFEPLGGIHTKTVDTRVILATNEDLAAAVAAGRFRQDLYYRINVVEISLPPLRQRPDDIPPLVDHFLATIALTGGRRTAGFNESAMEILKNYSWPGNIRQLENIVERAVLLASGPTLTIDDLPTELVRETLTAAQETATCRDSQDDPVDQLAATNRLRGALAEPERQIILRALRDHHWNRSLTAQRLGINRTTLYKKMKRLGLNDPLIRHDPTNR